MARAGLAQRLDLGRALAHAQLAQHRAGGDLLGAGQRGAEAQRHARAHMRSATPTRATCRAAARRPGRTGRRSRPRAPSPGRGRPPGDACAAGSSSRGTTRNGLARRGQHQAGEPLELDGVVAGDVAQVGAGRQEQGVEARLGDGLPARARGGRARTGLSLMSLRGASHRYGTYARQSTPAPRAPSRVPYPSPARPPERRGRRNRDPIAVRNLSIAERVRTAKMDSARTPHARRNATSTLSRTARPSPDHPTHSR